MFKDYDKYLSQSLKVYLFVLIIIFIMKLVGLDYFGLDINNPILVKVNTLLSTYNLDFIYQFICLYFNFYLIKCITLKKYKLDIDTFIIPTINIIGTFILYQCDHIELYTIFNTTLLLSYFLFKRAKLLIIVKVFIINIGCQMLSLVIRNYKVEYYDILINSIMNFDYYIMLIIWYKLEKQGGVILCQRGSQEVGSSLQKKINLLTSLKELRKNLHSFKKLDKETKLSYIIYFILSLFWNVMSIVLILFVARINDTFIECLFILTSFWLSKKTFGKAFHLSSMTQCFIVSNITYYVLNRITTPLGISILVPIMLGVGLSYITSKFVKKLYKPLYKGMPVDVFENTILQVVDKDSVKYKICYDYFIHKQSAIYLANKYNYTEAGIRKIKDRINIEIKKLK